MPQVHGAVRGALGHCEEILAIESGSATDNPLVFTDNGDVLSGGNFHGAPLALALDYAAIATTDLMSISERRIDRLTNPDLSEGLPAFLAQHPGMQSGFMIAHVAAVALLNEAKVLAHPASVDNLPTSAGKEDHVSMGMTGALKLRTIVEDAENVLAIELLAAAEGLEFRRPLKAGVGVERAFTTLRSIAPRVDEDRALSTDIERVAEAIRSGKFDSADEDIMSEKRTIRAPRGNELSCKGWQQEAALRMLMNNLDPEVAENPDKLIVYGGTGRAARSWEAFDAIVQVAARAGKRRNTARPIGQTGRHFSHARGSAAGPDRQLESRRPVVELSGIQPARKTWPNDVWPDDRRLLDLHRQPGHRAGNVRNVFGRRANAISAARSKASCS